MRARLVLVLLLLVSIVPCSWGGELSFDAAFTPDDFADLTEVLADTIAFPNLGPAEPGGLPGFEVLGAAGGASADEDDSYWEHGIDGDTTFGTLSGERVIGRKGLPARLDVGAQFGKVLGEEFWGGELRWALLEGGNVGPALALRATYSRLDNAPIDLEVAEAQVVLSKGFLILTPYGAVGYRKASASAFFGDPAPRTHEVDRDGYTSAVGLRITPLPFIRVVAEVRQGFGRSYFIGFGVGL
jgi:hypothetical protein